MNTQSATAKALALFRKHGGMLRTGEALALGIHPRTLYALRDTGQLQRLSRGVYRLADAPPLAYPDLVSVAYQVPQGVICLISALSFHDLTTQVPHVVDVALRRGARRPAVAYPPVRFFWFSEPAWQAGSEEQRLDGVAVRLYAPAKTVADCFKYRHKLGLDIAVEALRRLVRRSDFQVPTLLEYARVCQVETVLRPYLEALL